ncbi:MAG: hypothetical protein K9L32_08330 [Chromatiaceae bacterium]|nr:hypothetical protein [Chromatiaceae bacterium]MCF8004197.1 hypothetical protein [Chromatiaceae bacterium]MCF8015820.1 hypothetical protein [Chromatiaceae bacterium]
MDPLSALFAGFLQSAGDAVAQRAFDGMNTEIETVVTEYHGERIQFQHQLWRIKPETICADKRQQVAAFSRCTQAAQALFQEACTQLTANPRRDPAYRSLRSMYCNAGERFQPTEASIQWSNGGPPTAESEACRLAKAMLVVDNSAANRTEMRNACKP